MEKNTLDRSIVRPLPESVASRIAAGEVIERPASVLKELIENSLDAGASKIVVEIKDAGKELIRVSDNGTGLLPEDCRAAFLRHTTSKIFKLSDLDKLATFGFRGEALFSIAAVSKTTLTSRAKGRRSAWRITLEGGCLAKEHEAPPVDGTTIEVKELFYNTPARAKFLKSDGTERSQLARVVEETALAHPDVAFVLKSEGKVKADYPAQKRGGEKAMRRRVKDVLGEAYGSDLLYSERDAAGVSVSAFHSASDSLHATRGLQYIFVNRRPVANKTVQQALYRAYEPFRERNRHPAAVIFLEVPSAKVDVNVHPTKREVRFRPDNAVYQAVTQAMSRSLLDSKGIPTLSNVPTAPSAGGSWKPSHTSGDEGRATQPSLLSGSFSEDTRPHGAARVWYSDSIRYLGQVEQSYLLFEVDGGILIVDQHAAQEKILFEKYMQELTSGKLSMQELIIPLSIDLPASGIEKVLSKKKRLRRAGFEIDAFGKTKLHVTSAPALFHKAKDIQEMVHGLLDSLISPSAAAADIRYDATATIACKAAVKAHDALSAKEAMALIKELRKCEDATCCPHGRPTMLDMNRGELARRFGRPGPPPL
jgi:DNA mismatch repair protein MutL